MVKARGLGRVYQPTYQDRKTREKRTSPTWWIDYSFRGTKYRESSRSSKRRDAVKLLRTRLGEIGRGLFVGPDIDRTTFEDLAKIITDDYEVNGRRSKNRMRTSLKALCEIFGPSLARDLTFDRLNSYIAKRLAAGIAPATVKNDLAILRRAFRLAERAGKAFCPPVPALRVSNTRSGFFEEDQFREVLKHLPGEIRPVVMFAYHTGWRIRSEVLPLQWRHVDLSAGTVRLESGTTKNGEGRLFPFGNLPELKDILRAQRHHTTELQAKTERLIPWVFHRNGRSIKDFPQGLEDSV